jgi:hypothetical protein
MNLISVPAKYKKDCCNTVLYSNIFHRKLCDVRHVVILGDMMEAMVQVDPIYRMSKAYCNADSSAVSDAANYITWTLITRARIF